MKITPFILSIPPYISTSWEWIRAIHAQEDTLSVLLFDGSTCSIPNPSKKLIEDIFAMHAKVLEKKGSSREELNPFIQNIQSGFKDLIGTLSKLGTTAFASLSKMVEHDPQSSNLPPLPEEMVQKVKLLHQILSKEELAAMAPPEPGCSCIYCQIIHILRESSPHESEHVKEVEHVEEKDLEFTEWNVTHIGENLYKVTNKLDPSEEYRVFLGDPIGCTCGKQNCDHIVAVLKS